MKFIYFLFFRLVVKSSFKQLALKEGHIEDIDSVKTLFLLGYLKKTLTF